MSNVPPTLQKDPKLHDRPFTVFAWTLGIAFMVAGLIHAGLIAFAPRIYTSDAVVDFSVDSTNSLTRTAGLRQRILAEFQTIDSPGLKSRVVEELQLDEVWGKRYNRGVTLPLRDTVKILSGRMDLYSPQDAQRITIRVYGENPLETVKIANSLAGNYCNGFTALRGISARILSPAELPAKVRHSNLIFEIPKAVFRSAVMALLAAGVAWGFAKVRIQMPPPLPPKERAPQRFQKY